MTRILIILFLLLPCTLLAQFTISGKVVNHDDSHLVANASVFLNNATIGGKTDDGGVFQLHNIKPGKYELIVSLVGFSPFSRSVTVENADVSLADIFLYPRVVALNEVTVTSKEDPNRQSYIDLFKSQFLGNSELAKACKIINPELLDLKYDEKTKTLVGSSVDFLTIENKGLGYRIKYLLSNFTLNNNQNAGQFYYEGSVLFEELKGHDSEEKKWQERRAEVYANSSAHFLRSAINNRLGQEGFTVLRFRMNPERPADSLINAKIKVFSLLNDQSQYRDSLAFWIKKSKLSKLLPKQVPLLATSKDLIEKTGKHGLYALKCDKDAIYVVYNKSHQFKANSLSHLYDQNNISSTLVIFNVPTVYFDRNGSITSPGSLTYSGAWANKRIAELLPVNYEPGSMETSVDSTAFKKVNDKLLAYTTGHKTEKTYLHLDKPYYAAGDTIYFKAYVTDPVNKLSTLSSILHVELINPDDRTCQALKLKLVGGTCTGDFALADTLENGNYRLRAYTNIMRNEGETYFFDQYLVIANNASKAPQTGGKTHYTNSNDLTTASSPYDIPGKMDVQFFPEGGNIISGTPSNIAFKATAANGLGIEIKGTVTDEQGRQVTTFASQHLGMGLITMMPQAGKRYKVNIEYADARQTFDLPEADDKGYSFSVDNSDPVYVRVNVTAGLQNQQTQIRLVAQSGGIIYSYTSGVLVNKRFTTIIPKNIFPDGIEQFTLFSANGEPMNERLVFIRNPGRLNLKLATEKTVYHARQKVILNLVAMNNDHQPVPGNFSVAVINKTVVPMDEASESTILSNLLLTSDLKGYVEKPNYYFTGQSARIKSDLDVLMLTQGYHRFEWKQVLAGKCQPSAFQSEKITRVSGKMETLAGKPVPYGKVSLLSVSRFFFALDTTADENGRFEFKHFPIIDSARYIIQATDKNVKKNTLIEIDNVAPPDLKENKNIPDQYIKKAEDMMAYLALSNEFHREQLKRGIGEHDVRLKEIVIKDKTQRKYLKNSSNLNGAGNANHVITTDQLPLGCPVLTDCITGSLGRIRFFNGTPYLTGQTGDMESAVFIDGVEVTTPKSSDQMGPSKADIINSLSVTDVASIEIITDASLSAMYGIRGGGGVIIITTKRWNDVTSTARNLRTNYAYYSPVVYYKARTFYSPQYDSPPINSPFADLRTTIYWNPNLVIDKNGTIALEFFNADTKGDYQIVVEGIDENGNIGRQVYSYKVQ